MFNSNLEQSAGTEFSSPMNPRMRFSSTNSCLLTSPDRSNSSSLRGTILSEDNISIHSLNTKPKPQYIPSPTTKAQVFPLNNSLLRRNITLFKSQPQQGGKDINHDDSMEVVVANTQDDNSLDSSFSVVSSISTTSREELKSKLRTIQMDSFSNGNSNLISTHSIKPSQKLQSTPLFRGHSQPSRASTSHNSYLISSPQQLPTQSSTLSRGRVSQQLQLQMEDDQQQRQGGSHKFNETTTQSQTSTRTIVQNKSEQLNTPKQFDRSYKGATHFSEGSQLQLATTASSFTSAPVSQLNSHNQLISNEQYPISQSTLPFNPSFNQQGSIYSLPRPPPPPRSSSMNSLPQTANNYSTSLLLSPNQIYQQPSRPIRSSSQQALQTSQIYPPSPSQQRPSTSQSQLPPRKPIDSARESPRVPPILSSREPRFSDTNSLIRCFDPQKQPVNVRSFSSDNRPQHVTQPNFAKRTGIISSSGVGFSLHQIEDIPPLSPRITLQTASSKPPLTPLVLSSNKSTFTVKSLKQEELPNIQEHLSTYLASEQQISFSKQRTSIPNSPLLSPTQEEPRHITSVAEARSFDSEYNTFSTINLFTDIREALSNMHSSPLQQCSTATTKYPTSSSFTSLQLAPIDPIDLISVSQSALNALPHRQISNQSADSTQSASLFTIVPSETIHSTTQHYEFSHTQSLPSRKNSANTNTAEWIDNTYINNIVNSVTENQSSYSLLPQPQVNEKIISDQYETSQSPPIARVIVDSSSFSEPFTSNIIPHKFIQSSLIDIYQQLNSATNQITQTPPPPPSQTELRNCLNKSSIQLPTIEEAAIENSQSVALSSLLINISDFSEGPLASNRFEINTSQSKRNEDTYLFTQALNISNDNYDSSALISSRTEYIANEQQQQQQQQVEETCTMTLLGQINKTENSTQLREDSSYIIQPQKIILNKEKIEVPSLSECLQKLKESQALLEKYSFGKSIKAQEQQISIKPQDNAEEQPLQPSVYMSRVNNTIQKHQTTHLPLLSEELMSKKIIQATETSFIEPQFLHPQVHDEEFQKDPKISLHSYNLNQIQASPHTYLESTIYIKENLLNSLIPSERDHYFVPSPKLSEESAKHNFSPPQQYFKNTKELIQIDNKSWNLEETFTFAETLVRQKQQKQIDERSFTHLHQQEDKKIFGRHTPDENNQYQANHEIQEKYYHQPIFNQIDYLISPTLSSNNWINGTSPSIEADLVPAYVALYEPHKSSQFQQVEEQQCQYEINQIERIRLEGSNTVGIRTSKYINESIGSDIERQYLSNIPSQSSEEDQEYQEVKYNTQQYQTQDQWPLLQQQKQEFLPLQEISQQEKEVIQTTEDDCEDDEEPPFFDEASNTSRISSSCEEESHRSSIKSCEVQSNRRHEIEKLIKAMREERRRVMTEKLDQCNSTRGEEQSSTLNTQGSFDNYSQYEDADEICDGFSSAQANALQKRDEIIQKLANIDKKLAAATAKVAASTNSTQTRKITPNKQESLNIQAQLHQKKVILSDTMQPLMKGQGKTLSKNQQQHVSRSQGSSIQQSQMTQQKQQKSIEEQKKANTFLGEIQSFKNRNRKIVVQPQSTPIKQTTPRRIDAPTLISTPVSQRSQNQASEKALQLQQLLGVVNLFETKGCKQEKQRFK